MDVSTQTKLQRKLNNFGFLLGLVALPAVTWYVTVAIRYYDGRLVLPDAEQAGLLGIAASTPLLSVERMAYTYNDVPMELRRGLYLTDTHHYRNELS